MFSNKQKPLELNNEFNSLNQMILDYLPMKDVLKTIKNSEMSPIDDIYDLSIRFKLNEQCERLVTPWVEAIKNLGYVLSKINRDYPYFSKLNSEESCYDTAYQKFLYYYNDLGLMDDALKWDPEKAYIKLCKISESLLERIISAYSREDNEDLDDNHITLDHLKENNYDLIKSCIAHYLQAADNPDNKLNMGKEIYISLLENKSNLKLINDLLEKHLDAKKLYDHQTKQRQEHSLLFQTLTKIESNQFDDDFLAQYNEFQDRIAIAKHFIRNLSLKEINDDIKRSEQQLIIEPEDLKEIPNTLVESSKWDRENRDLSNLLYSKAMIFYVYEQVNHEGLQSNYSILDKAAIRHLLNRLIVTATNVEAIKSIYKDHIHASYLQDHNAALKIAFIQTLRAKSCQILENLSVNNKIVESQQESLALIRHGLFSVKHEEHGVRAVDRERLLKFITILDKAILELPPNDIQKKRKTCA